MQGARCRVQSVGCRVWGAGCRVQDVGCRVKGEIHLVLASIATLCLARFESFLEQRHDRASAERGAVRQNLLQSAVEKFGSQLLPGLLGI